MSLVAPRLYIGDLLEEAQGVPNVAGFKRFNNVLLRLVSY